MGRHAHRWGLVPAPSPFCPPALCNETRTPPPSPQMLRCDDKPMFAAALKKNIGVSLAGSHPSPLVPPGWPWCPPFFPTTPGQDAGLRVCRAFIWHFYGRGPRGWPSPAGRGARLCAGTTGSLNALKSCTVPRRIRPGPPHTGGFRAKLSWRRGLLLRGQPALVSPLLPGKGGMAEQGTQGGGASWWPGGGTWGYWETSTSHH